MSSISLKSGNKLTPVEKPENYEDARPAAGKHIQQTILTKDTSEPSNAEQNILISQAMEASPANDIVSNSDLFQIEMTNMSQFNDPEIANGLSNSNEPKSPEEFVNTVPEEDFFDRSLSRHVQSEDDNSHSPHTENVKVNINKYDNIDNNTNDINVTNGRESESNGEHYTERSGTDLDPIDMPQSKGKTAGNLAKKKAKDRLIKRVIQTTGPPFGRANRASTLLNSWTVGKTKPREQAVEGFSKQTKLGNVFKSKKGSPESKLKFSFDNVDSGKKQKQSSGNDKIREEVVEDGCVVQALGDPLEIFDLDLIQSVDNTHDPEVEITHLEKVKHESKSSDGNPNDEYLFGDPISKTARSNKTNRQSPNNDSVERDIHKHDNRRNDIHEMSVKQIQNGADNFGLDFQEVDKSGASQSIDQPDLLHDHTDELLAPDYDHTDELLAPDYDHTDELLAPDYDHTDELLAPDYDHTDELLAPDYDHTDELLKHSDDSKGCVIQNDATGNMTQISTQDNLSMGYTPETNLMETSRGLQIEQNNETSNKDKRSETNELLNEVIELADENVLVNNAENLSTFSSENSKNINNSVVEESQEDRKEALLFNLNSQKAAKRQDSRNGSHLTGTPPANYQSIVAMRVLERLLTGPYSESVSDKPPPPRTGAYGNHTTSSISKTQKTRNKVKFIEDNKESMKTQTAKSSRIHYEDNKEIMKTQSAKSSRIRSEDNKEIMKTQSAKSSRTQSEDNKELMKTQSVKSSRIQSEDNNEIMNTQSAKSSRTQSEENKKVTKTQSTKSNGISSEENDEVLKTQSTKSNGISSEENDEVLKTQSAQNDRAHSEESREITKTQSAESHPISSEENKNVMKAQSVKNDSTNSEEGKEIKKTQNVKSNRTISVRPTNRQMGSIKSDYARSTARTYTQKYIESKAASQREKAAAVRPPKRKLDQPTDEPDESAKEAFIQDEDIEQAKAVTYLSDKQDVTIAAVVSDFLEEGNTEMATDEADVQLDVVDITEPEIAKQEIPDGSMGSTDNNEIEVAEPEVMALEDRQVEEEASETTSVHVVTDEDIESESDEKEKQTEKEKHTSLTDWFKSKRKAKKSSPKLSKKQNAKFRTKAKEEKEQPVNTKNVFLMAIKNKQEELESVVEKPNKEASIKRDISSPPPASVVMVDETSRPEPKSNPLVGQVNGFLQKFKRKSSSDKKNSTVLPPTTLTPAPALPESILSNGVGKPHDRSAAKSVSIQSLTVPGLLANPFAGESAIDEDSISIYSRRDSTRQSFDSGSRKSVDYRIRNTALVVLPESDEKPKSNVTNDESFIKNAIPFLPMKLAVICLALNIIVPGSGTVLSGMSILCCGQPRLSNKGDQVLVTFCANFMVGLAQLFTITFLLVGWFWSIGWGIQMVLLSVQHEKDMKEQRTKELQSLALSALGSPKRSNLFDT